MKTFIALVILSMIIVFSATLYGVYAFYAWDLVPEEETVETVEIEAEPNIDPTPIEPETPRTMLEIGS